MQALIISELPASFQGKKLLQPVSYFQKKRNATDMSGHLHAVVENLCGSAWFYLSQTLLRIAVLLLPYWGSQLPDSGKPIIFNPPGLQTIIMNRNTLFISTKALSITSSGVSTECSFLRIILTGVMVKLLLSGVLNVSAVKGVDTRIS